MRKQTALYVLITVLLLCFTSPAAAQDGGGIWVTSPDVGEFPNVTLYFEPFDSQGTFVAGLQPQEVQVVENGETLPINELQQFEPGLQIILSLNVGPVMENHTAGISNYDHIRGVLQNWALSQPFETPDSFSLVTNSGPQRVQLTLPADWDRALEEYQPDMLSTQPSLTSLSSALDLAMEAAPNPYSKRTILYITQAMTEQQLASLPALTGRATQLDVRVFTWLVAAAPGANPQTAEALTQLSSATGGQFMLFSGSEELPDPETYLRPLRYIYFLKYNSAIQQSGAHSLSVEINHQEFQAASEPQPFELSVQPPNPIFLSPPVQVEISPPSLEDGNIRGTAPYATIIESIIEFPDGHSRDISRSYLYVDDELVAQNTMPPFDRFEWQLGEYQETGTHLLRVEVEDVLGMRGESIEMPVEVVVESAQGVGGGSGRVLIITAVLLAAAVLLVVLILAGKRTIPLALQARRRRELQDPVTQPVRVRQDSAATEPRRRPAVPQSLPVQTALARLVRVSDNGHMLTEDFIALAQGETTLGSDPGHAIRVLDSPSVSALHARLQRTGEGKYILADAGSTGGTWINYAPVSTHGARLENGDLIHFGRMAFRFETNPQQSVEHPQIPLNKGE